MSEGWIDGDRRIALLTAGQGDDFRPGMAKQDFDQLQGRVARGPQNSYPCHIIRRVRGKRLPGAATQLRKYTATGRSPPRGVARKWRAMSGQPTNGELMSGV